MVYRAIPPTMWEAIPGQSPLEAMFMQDVVVDMDPISLIITSLDVKGAFPDTPHHLLQAIREHKGMYLCFCSGNKTDEQYTDILQIRNSPCAQSRLLFSPMQLQLSLSEGFNLPLQYSK